MNKKIYFDHKFIEFTQDPAQFSENQSFVIHTRFNRQIAKEIAAMFTDGSDARNILITGQDFEKVLDSLKKEFHYIEAAGGVISNKDRHLFIRRHNRWDLPKGKLEKGEEIEHAAIRECEEECGVRDLEIKGRLSSTFHVYAHKGGFALKQTYWFRMGTTYDGLLVPQLEEDISEVCWFTRQQILSKVLPDTYYTIADVTREALLKSH